MPYLNTADPALIRGAIESSVAELIKYLVRKTRDILHSMPDRGGTPRDTTFATNSWIISIGAPSSEVAGSKQSVDRGPSLAGLKALRAYTVDQGAVFLVNNTEYIHVLNYGYSPQAAAGFVERAFQRGMNATQRKFQDLSSGVTAGEESDA